MNRDSISVIIPTLDEASQIAGTVAHVRALAPRVEIFVVDGGSRDDSRRLAVAAGAKVISSARGRGKQCHAGAERASGEVLVFLHADTHLPVNAFSLLADAFADPAVQIGTFGLRFDRNHWLLRAYAFLARLDSVWTRFGDQCICVRAGFYHELGGFPA